MNFGKIFNVLDTDENIVEKLGFNPYYVEIESGLDEKIIINQKEYINLASNNYLGLANNSIVKKGVIEAVEKYGASLCGTPIATGYVSIFKMMEKKMANFLKLDEALIFPSGYQANLGIFNMFLDKEDIVLVDRFAHSSLVQGIMATGCKLRPFLHNNIDHLEAILKKIKGYKNIFIVTESVFSTDGTCAPLKDLTNIANKYNAFTIVDDSHGIGVLGKNGRGVLEEEEIEEFNGIYTASLGKAIGNSGGVVAGNSKLIKCLRYYCSHLVYSTALTPGTLGGINSVLDIIEKDYPKIKTKMINYSKIIYSNLKKRGFNVLESKVPINSIKTGKKENTFKLAKLFFDNGIFTTPFVEPSVPNNDGRVRLITCANLKDSIIDEIVGKIGECKI
ncbi:MAG: pyridoxal phosphate-dependent aminotransferase family protein [Clostridiales bacterium]